MTKYRFKSEALDAAMRLIFTDEEIDRVIDERWNQDGASSFFFWGPGGLMISVNRNAVIGNPIYVRDVWNCYPQIIPPTEDLWLTQTADNDYRILYWRKDAASGSGRWIDPNSSRDALDSHVAAFRELPAQMPGENK